MKLLTPTQLKNQKEEDQARQILRSRETREAITDLNRQLAKAQADFSETLYQSKKKWADEEQKHSMRVSEMNKEIEELEKKRRKELEPIHLVEKRVQQTMTEALEFAHKVEQREEDLEERAELLEAHLDRLGEREQTVIAREKALQVRIYNNEVREKSIGEENKKLGEMLKDFVEDKERTEIDINKRKMEVFLKERSSEEHANNLKEKERALRVWATQLESERKALDEAYKHTGLSPSNTKEKAL